MKHRILAALFLAGFATASLAQGNAHPDDYDMPIVKNADSCPAGFYPSVPSYKWSNGHFVRNGWACESLYKDRE